MTDRHEQLLDELLQLFLDEGFLRFRIADLAARLHCSKSTLYELGHSKEQLVINAVKQFFRIATAAVERRTAEHEGSAARIAAYLTAVADALRPASVQFMADLGAHPPARAVYERNTRAAANRVRELIAAGVEGGEFRAVHAKFVADTVAATMERIQVGEVTRATGLRDSDAYQELTALVLTGIQQPALVGE